MTLELTVFLGYGSDARADTLMIQRLDRGEFTQADVDKTTRSLNDADSAADEIERLDSENQRLKAKVEGWMRSATNDGLTIQKISRERGAAQDDADRWRTAFESLHARILRDLPGDASELLQPDDEFWAAQLDGLVTYADEVYRRAAVSPIADDERP